MRVTKIRIGLAGVGLVTSAVLIAACTGGTDVSSAPHAATTRALGPATLQKVEHSAESFNGPDSAGSGGATTSGATTQAATSATVPGTATAGGRSALIVDTRDLIRIADMSVAVKNPTAVAAAANRAEELVTGYGGEVFSDDRTSGKDASAVLQLKVPPADLTSTLTKLSALGIERSRSLSSQDVTTVVADVSARLQSAQDSIARLRTLYGRATRVSDVIAIENELATREADLESLEAQQRSLVSETAFATVNLTLETAKAHAAKKKSHRQTAFVRGLHRGWHHFSAAASWLLSAIATVLPFAVLVALVIALFGWGRRRRSRPAALIEL
jgi:hypothetical protein